MDLQCQDCGAVLKDFYRSVEFPVHFRRFFICECGNIQEVLFSLDGSFKMYSVSHKLIGIKDIQEAEEIGLLEWR